MNAGHLYFSESHEWISKDSKENVFYIGISDFAQSELGDIVYIALPEVGKTYKKDDKMGEIESVKSVSEIYAPVDIKIISVNPELNDAPELINQDPLASGYIAEVQVLNAADIEGLMDKNAYESFIASAHE